MNKFLFPAALCGLFTVSACAQMPAFLRPDDAPSAGESSGPMDATGATDLAAVAPSGAVAPPPPRGARTADEFDTTTAEQRAQAQSATPDATETRLGETVASLGDPTQTGFWIKTPLTRTAGPGRIENPATGKSAKVDLIPLDGPESGGSQVSLAALRLLDAPLTDLPTLVVYAN